MSVKRIIGLAVVFVLVGIQSFSTSAPIDYQCMFFTFKFTAAAFVVWMLTD